VWARTQKSLCGSSRALETPLEMPGNKKTNQVVIASKKKSTKQQKQKPKQPSRLLKSSTPAPTRAKPKTKSIVRADIPFAKQFTYPKPDYNAKHQKYRDVRTILLSGQDYLQPLRLMNRAVGSSDDIRRGQLVYEVNFNPTMMHSATLNTYAKMYDMFRFKRLSIEYKPEVPVTTQGAVLAVAIDDPTDKPPAAWGDTNIDYATSKTATFAQVFNAFNLNWRASDDTWYHCANAQAEVSDEVQGKCYVFALGAPVLENDQVHHTVSFGSMFFKYEIEFKDLNMKDDQPSTTELEIWDDVTPIGAGSTLQFSAEGSFHGPSEYENFKDGEIDELMVTSVGQSALDDSGVGEGNIVYATTQAPNLGGSNGVAVLINIFLTLADVFLQNVAFNRGTATIAPSTSTPLMKVQKMRLNPVRVNHVLDQLIIDNKKIDPRYNDLVSKRLVQLREKQPDAVHRYVQTHLKQSDYIRGAF